MDKPTVSVVVPIYNVGLYLDRCLESIVNQSYKNLEIILVDDGSLDNCPSMCDDWAKKDDRIKVIHKENAGLGMARNTGIDAANGEYIFFFDSDDYVDLTIVEKCVASASENNSDVVIFGALDAYDDGTTKKIPLKLIETVFNREQILEKLLPGMFTYDMGFGISAWGKMYRLCIFKEKNVRFVSEREIISEDAYFALEFYSKIKKASIVNENLYYYYRRNDSLSRIYKEDRQIKNDEFIEKSLTYIKENALPDSVKNHITARYHMYTVAAAKQLWAADIDGGTKKKQLCEILKSKTLRDSVDVSVLKLHKKSVAVFLLFAKLKCYALCRALLSFKK